MCCIVLKQMLLANIVVVIKLLSPLCAILYMTDLQNDGILMELIPFAVCAFGQGNSLLFIPESNYFI